MKNNGCLVRINSLDESDDWLIQSDDWLTDSDDWLTQSDDWLRNTVVLELDREIKCHYHLHFFSTCLNNLVYLPLTSVNE